MAVCSALATPIVNVTGSNSVPVLGVYTYSYEVANQSTTETVWRFWIQLGQGVTINSVSDVDGWTTFTDWALFVEWSSDDPSYDILPGNSLSGFSYDSTGIPGTVVYEAAGYDPELGPTEPYASGFTVGATPIPEPGTFLLLVSGLAGFLAYARFRRRMN